MATYSLTQYSDKYPHSQFENAVPVKTISATFSGAAAAASKGSAIATSDVIELINVPAGAFVLAASVKVSTVEGGTCTFHIGDGADADGFAASVNGNTAANTVSFNATTTPAFGVGKYYTANDTIDVTLATGTAANVVAAITIAYIDFNV